MFAVLFEVKPRQAHVDTYLEYATMLRPELQRIGGFVDNVRYKSLRHTDWILSVSTWATEKSLVRWRTHARHHQVQGNARLEVLEDYHLRVGPITTDTRLPTGYQLREQRLDETEVGEAVAVTLIAGRCPADWVRSSTPAEVAARLGLPADAPGLVGWDVCDAILTPGDVTLLLSWRTSADAKSFRRTRVPEESARLREIRVIRDYGMNDRRENPQYFPDPPSR